MWKWTWKNRVWETGYNVLAVAPPPSGPVQERFLRAFITEGGRIDDTGALARLAGDAGMDAPRVAAVLDGDEFPDEGGDDQAEAAALGRERRPFFVGGSADRVSGAQPVEVFTELLEHAWAQRQPVSMLAGSPNADACGADRCGV